MASFLTKRLAVGDSRATLNIWDTAGQERFHSLGPIYYRDAHGAVLVYDITDNSTFHQVKKWVKELKKMVGESIEIAIVGNKCDLERNRQVSLEEAQEYASSVGAKHFLTSAKLKKGVDDVFLDLTKRIMDKVASEKPQGESRSAAAAVLVSRSGAGNKSRDPARRSTLQIVADDAPQKGGEKKKGGCCS